MIDCVLIAGGVPQPADPLYPFAKGQPKTLIELAGRPMAQWVVTALTKTEEVGKIVVVGLPPDAGLRSAKIARYLPAQGSLLANGLAGIDWLLEHDPTARQALLCCADIPLLRPEMVSWLIAEHQRQPVDITYTVVSRAVMEAAFPGADRSYAHFAEIEVAGGDIQIADPQIFQSHDQLWHHLSAGRKSLFKQALQLGPWACIKLLLRRLALSELEVQVQRKFGLNVHVLPVSYPEMGMDIDKPHQLEICRRRLERD